MSEENSGVIPEKELEFIERIDALGEQVRLLTAQNTRLRDSNRAIAHQLDTVLIDMGRMLKAISHARKDLDV